MQVQEQNRSRALAATLLLGSFAFGFNAATLLHELGHALAAWASGAKVTKLFVHPFSWSYTTWTHSRPVNEVLLTWAGAVFGLVAAILLYLLGLRWRSSMAAPLLMTGIAACFYNGLYYIVDALVGTGGDAHELLKLGTPLWILLGFGVVSTVLGLALTIPAMPMMGLGREDSLGFRVLIFQLGFGPYLLAMILYHVISGHQVGLWAVYGGAGLVIVAIAGLLSGAIGRTIGVGNERRVSIQAVVVSLVLGIGCVVIELVLVGDSRPGN